jgi:Cys-tRNA(Pro)/Cys-tRNA(Cys) deacylase
MKKSPAAVRRRAQTSKTRISAIADFAAECKRKTKALPLFPPAREDLFHPPLQGESRRGERSELRRGGVAVCLHTPHPGDLRSPTLPLQGRVKEGVMSKATRATKMLEQAGVAFTVHTYDYDPDADRIGMQAAEALGEPPARVLKTLMALVDGKPVCVIVPSDREVSMKKLAAAFGGKSAQMTRPAEAERVSGYKVGGISPFGQMRRVATAIEEQSLAHELVFMNGGQRGLQVRLSPRDAMTVLGAIAAPLVA